MSTKRCASGLVHPCAANTTWESRVREEVELTEKEKLEGLLPARWVCPACGDYIRMTKLDLEVALKEQV